MADGIRIDALPTTVAPNLNHVVPAMHDGIAVRLSLAQILALGRIATTLADGTDFDTITSNGVFILTSDVNAPATGGRWLVRSIVDPSDTGRVFHEALLISGGSGPLSYTRRSAGGAFGSWLGGIPTADLIPYAGSGFPGAGNVQAAIDEAANYTGFVQSETTLQNFVRGLTLSNNGADANNDIDIATGQARGNSVTVTNSATLTKRLDASWAEGANQGGLDTGSKANSTTYHVHAIRKDADGTFDALFSTSVGSPTMPSGWTRVQRLGAVLTDGSGNIRAFIQSGNEFWLNTEGGVTNYVASGARSKAALSITVPSGIRVRAILAVYIHASAVDATANASVYDGANTSIRVRLRLYGSASVNGGEWEVRQYSDTSSNIQFSLSSVHASTQSSLSTLGWEDYTIPRI